MILMRGLLLLRIGCVLAANLVLPHDWPSQEAGTSLERRHRLDPRAFVFPKAIASQHVNQQHIHDLGEASMLRIGAVGINLRSKPCQQQLNNASVRALITASAADDIGPLSPPAEVIGRSAAVRILHGSIIFLPREFATVEATSAQQGA